MPSVEGRADTPSGTVRERVTLEAGYGDERMPVYLFLPKDGRPPYQAVIYFPALNRLSIAHVEQHLLSRRLRRQERPRAGVAGVQGIVRAHGIRRSV